MLMKSNAEKKAMKIAKERGILRPRDLKRFGIARIYLTRLVEKGMLTKVGHGLYTTTDSEPTDKHSIAQVSKKIPEGVICLLSALQFHEITTQQPNKVWIAIDMKSRQPKTSALPVKVVRFSKSALTEGVEEHIIEGVLVKAYSLTKTIADCFKYRNKIGLEIALDALRECRRERKCSNDDLWYYAKICRVTNVMRPYMESMP